MKMPRIIEIENIRILNNRYMISVIYSNYTCPTYMRQRGGKQKSVIMEVTEDESELLAAILKINRLWKILQ